MTELHIPIKDQAVLAYWQAQAEQSGRSIEQEIGAVLSREAALRAQESRKKRRKAEEKWWKELTELRESIRAKHGNLPDITQMIREERDARG